MNFKIKSIFFSILFIIGIGTYAQKNNKPFEPYTDKAEIEIAVKGAPEGLVKLILIYGNQKLKKDSAMADANGKVIFKDSVRYPEGQYYIVYSDNFAISILIAQNQKFYVRTDKKDLNANMKTNSAENRLYFDNFIYEADFAKRMDKIKAKMADETQGTKEYDADKEEMKKLTLEKREVVKNYSKNNPGSFFAAFKLMGQNPILPEPKLPNGEIDSTAQLILFRNAYWENFDFDDGRIVNTPVFYNKLTYYLTKLFPQRVDSIMIGIKYLMPKLDKGNKELFNFAVNYLAITYRESSVMGGEKIYCYIVDNYFTYEKAFWTDSTNIFRVRAQSDLMRPSLLGKTGQNLNCKNEQGEYVSLYSIKKPIKIVYLYNPDCEHCKKETPILIKLYEKWKSKGLEVYALNVEREYDKWHDFIKTLNLDWINVIDPDNENYFYQKYYVNITPGLYVLDSKNKIVAKQLMQPEQLERVFEKILKDTPNYNDTSFPEQH